MPTKLTDADRLKIAMALLQEVAHYDSTSVVHGALRIQAREVFIEYKASRPEVVAQARAAIARLESEPTESVSALINATVQMNYAMDVARGVDADVPIPYSVVPRSERQTRVDPANVDGLNGVDDRGFDR